jgi:hypothetical protein
MDRGPAAGTSSGFMTGQKGDKLVRSQVLPRKRKSHLAVAFFLDSGGDGEIRIHS